MGSRLERDFAGTFSDYLDHCKIPKIAKIMTICEHREGNVSVSEPVTFMPIETAASVSPSKLNWSHRELERRFGNCEFS